MALEKLERKLLNLILLVDLMGLNKKMLPDQEKEKRIQDKRVRKLMKKAYQIPFYKERFIKNGLKPEDFQTADDLYKFPVLTKDELRVWMDKEAEKPKYKHYYLDTTSGSSGTPTKVLYSPLEKAFNMANWMRVLMKSGYNPVTGNTVSRLSAHSTSAGQKNALQKMGFLRRDFVHQYEAEPTVIKEINELKPDLLYMNKTELMRIALYSVQNNVPVYHPQYFVPTGEKIDDQARALFKQVLGDGMIDSFGTAETGACMAKYPGRNEYLIHNDLFVVNVCDDESKPAKEGRLCVTPLYKTDIPLINYVVGDRAACDIIDGRKVVTSVQGRLNDVIRHANGEVSTFFMIAPIFAHFEEIVQVRLIQNTYEDLLIQAVLGQGISKDRRPAIEEDTAKQINAKLRKPMHITFEWMDVIPPDENGKLRLIVSKVK